MKMDANIRVRTDKRYKMLYNQLKQLVVGDMHELFFICASIGYQNNAKKPLGKEGEERFWSLTITPEEWCCFYAMILKDNNMNFVMIQDDKKVIGLMEAYANAGMEMLIRECLEDFLLKNREVIFIDSTAQKELPKMFLSYVFEKSIETGNGT